MEWLICQQIFAIWGLVIFLLKILLKSASNSSYFFSALAEQRCVALTDEGVHVAATLLNACRVGAECRLSQADAAWVRNVIADSENFLPKLLREVP